MNERLYALCADLSDEERKRDRQAFFRSIHGTLNHLLLTDRLWLGRFREKPLSFARLDQELYADFGALRRERGETDAAITSWVATLSDAQLAAPFTYTSYSNPKLRTLPLWLPVTHLFNHQTHHRGQLTTLLMQAGRDPGVTDLMWLPGLEAISAAGCA
ncbi:MAG: DinB family protein [Candidatus Limnocylindria bacterium]